MEIGRKIFYLLANGQPVYTITPFTIEFGDFQPLTQEQEFETYTALHGLSPDAVGSIQLDYGQFEDEFRRYPFRIDVSTQTILWDTAVDRTAASLDQVKTAKIEQLNDFCNRAIASGFSSAALGVEHTYPSDQEAQNNLQIVIRRLEIGEEQAAAGLEEAVLTYPFQTLDAGYLDHSLKQLKQVFSDGVDAGTKHVMHFRELKAQVEAASTAEEVDAIQW